jgi:hypothetical protein
MAKASVKYKDIQVNLTLNENELKLLMTVLGYVGGCPDHSARKYADSIYKAIKDLKLDLGDFNKELDPIYSQVVIFK